MSNNNATPEGRIEVLSHVVLVQLDINLWSGRTQMTPRDLRAVSGDQIPPETLASLGHKKTADPKDLAPFSAMKKEAERVCYAEGTRFMGGYAIPEDRLPEVAKKLNEIKSRFYGELDGFIANYDSRIDKWIEAHAEWGSIIRQAIVPSNRVRDRMAFRWLPVKINPVGDNDFGGDLADEAAGLAPQLFREVAQMAKETWSKSFEGRPKVTQRAKSPLRAMRHKLNNLSFIAPEVSPIVREIDQTLDGMPRTGNITGRDLGALSRLVLLLSDEDAMKSHGQKSIDLANSGASETDEGDLQEEGDDPSEPQAATPAERSDAVDETPEEPETPVVEDDEGAEDTGETDEDSAEESGEKEVAEPAGWFF